MAQLALPRLTRGIRSRCRHSLLTSFMEKEVTVSSPLLFVFSPPFRFFLTASFLQLNCSSVGRAGRPPSVNKGIKGTSLPYLPTTCLQKAAAVSLPLHFIFSPTIPIFSHSFLFPKLPVSRPRRSPSLGQLRDQGPAASIPACDRLQKAAAVSLPLFFIFPPPFRFFLTASFFPKLLVSRPRRPPSLSQVRDQGPVAAISARNSPAKGGGPEFSPPFYFFPTIWIISHGFFFTIKLLFSWPCWPPSLRQLRDQGPSLPYLPAACLQKAAAVSFPLPFIFSPPFQLFLTDSFLQLYCSLPSVYQGNKCTSLPSPCCLLHGEAGYCEFSSCFKFPPLF